MTSVMTASTSCGPTSSRMSLPPPTSSPQNSTRMSVMSQDLCRQGMSTSQLSPDLCHLPMSSSSGMSPDSCRQNLMSNRPPSTSLLQVIISKYLSTFLTVIFEIICLKDQCLRQSYRFMRIFWLCLETWLSNLDSLG